MNKYQLLLLVIFNGFTFSVAQKSIDFEYALPENSEFIIKSKIESVGTMKVSGDKTEMEAYRKTGYNQERSVSYLFDIDVNMKTFKKTEESFPFQFSYEKIKMDIDSDGKKNNQRLSFPDIMISGDLRKDKEVITNVQKSGDATKDNFINSMPKEFLRQMISQKDLKTGDHFTVEKKVESAGDNFKMAGNFLYTLKKIDSDLAYFDIIINLLKDKTSDIKVSGKGSGEMIYNHQKHYVISENTLVNIDAIQIEKTFKIEAKTNINSSFSIQINK